MRQILNNTSKNPHTNYSFRKGGASSIASVVSLATLKAMGRWKSDAYQYTLEQLSKDPFEVSRLGQ